MSTTSGRKPFIKLGAGVLAVVVVYALWRLVFATSAVQSTNDAFVSADFTLIAPKVAGFIDEVLVQDNQPVKAGQVVARIDPQDFKTNVQAAEASVATAQAQLANAQAMLERQRSVIAQAQATVDADLAQVEFAEHELTRYQHLAGQGAGTLQNSQQAKNRSQIARAELVQHKAALEAARQQTRVLAAQTNAAQASVQHAQALQARAELDLSYTQLVAPFDGVVGRRSVRQGAYVKPGDPVLAVVPLAKAFVVANFLEHQLTHMRAGQRVSIKVDTFPGETLQGTVDSIAPATGVTFASIAPDNATGNFTKVVQRIPVKITLDQGQPLARQLRLGMSVDASIDTESANGEQVSTR
ncbi:MULTISPECIES: HlyD family secretion protein [Pseudomonas]|uniref:HlyD family secretion protein n=1 Tax=Pseudomonas saxonica TaxID=2600598 RepID=A0A5C5Q245_9PSED|nr:MULTISPECIES: HlyD family secretion protein [Pseudomonas]MCH4875241.1 HlyD family secretion protein [Pseudomonas sp. TMW22091]TWR98053.1 HlyD family secretion protein [Pseudomonas saxonica]WRQ75233.1 HlyD family secretion protein [Pseudomonas saxonica]